MGYGDAGASYARKALKAFIARSGSPRHDIDLHNFTLRQRGRMLYMASPVATSAIRTTGTNVVGIGLKLESFVNRDILGMTPEQAKKFQNQIEAEWKIWADKKQNCDASGISNFNGLQQLALASALMSGDCFALFMREEKPTLTNPYTLRIKLVEADLVSTPDTIGTRPGIITEGKAKNGNFIYDGVEVDPKTSAIKGYYFCNQYPYEISQLGVKREWVRVEAYGEKTGLPNVLHILDPERIGQYRGVTFLAPVIEQLLQIRRYTEAELMAALVQSFFTAWIKTESNPSIFPTNETNEDENSSDDDDEYEMGPGQVTHLKTGEDITFGNPNIPTNGFDSFVKSVATQIGAALEIPRDVLLKEFNSSYSASRGALLEAYRFFLKKREWLVNSFCQPAYEVWFAEAVARGRIRAPGFFSDPLIRAAYCGAKWIGPAQSQLDPKKEVEAQALAVRNGFKTPEQATSEMGGGSWEDNAEGLKEQMKLINFSDNTPEGSGLSETKEEGENT